MEAQTLFGARIRSMFTDQVATSWRHGFLGDYVIDDCYGTSEKTTDDPTGTPIFRMGNIQEGRLDTRNLKYLHIRENERPKLVLEKGDILVNRTNSAELVGKCAVFDLDGVYGFASYLIRLRLDQSRADPWLVARYINSPIGREYMFRERKQMTGQANVNSKKLKGLPIRLPPIEKQHRITPYLDDLERQIETITQLQVGTAAELDALLPSILDKAFKGEL
jgi:type I restriction enzyme S subunit